MSAKPVWNRKRVSDLKFLWEQGLSGTDIADRMNLSRGAVLSAARRYKLPSRLLTAEERVKRRPSNKRDPNAMPPTPVKEITEPPPATAVSIMGLKHRHCRMIVSPIYGSDTLYCGGEKSVGSFCDKHAGVVFIDPKVYAAARKTVPKPWPRRR